MKLGIDLLVARNFDDLKGQRVGLISHEAARASDLRGTIELFAKHTNLSALFGPEHGLDGTAQDLIPVAGGSRDAIPVFTLYGDTFESLKPTPAMLNGLDVMVLDLQDIGSRYYTFQATMLFCLEACASAKVPVLVLDRPNPLGRTVEGPTLDMAFSSFVGPHPICIRHGLTMGELAQLYQRERVPNAELHVIRCEDHDFTREWTFPLPPSPNMPTLDTARVYPGMCQVEGTNLSEGRGTTRPFECVGFPGMNSREVIDELVSLNLPGVQFLPITFRPTFQKHMGKKCEGLFLVVTDASRFQPVKTGTAVVMLIRRHLGAAFRWRTETYEFVSNIPAIDLLFGSDRERKAIEAGARFDDVIAPWQEEETAFHKRRQSLLGVI